MKIQKMFKEDIDRKINGVVKVDQDESDVLVQELNEYVITRELKKHFITFFNNYGDAFREATADIGVWISGFFGSGKSHFLKMLSYLLENKEVQGVRTVERFRKKFEEDPATFMLIDAATGAETHTILFNIDIEGSINKDKTAVLRVFAKMFYNYLGFYGENLKVAKLEQFIDRQGKTEVFRRVFEEHNGGSWLESRDAYAFFEDDIVATLQEVLGMSETAARNWFNGEETIETSVAQLVSEIREYVESKPANFRLLFMADEVGQYVGGDRELLLNLQSLVEKIGTECKGKVWVVCTGQEAIDEIIKARENEFSRIQARFKTRLSLSSSSVDEVIQERILKKTDESILLLEGLYDTNESVLRNLFSFTDAILDIKGYNGPSEFARNFPFVPYQFILMQKVFAEIRKHGNSGKHLSGGERSMLSGFQEAAQKIELKDEYALAPFYLFYDTVHTFLDSSIRNVIERCERAAEKGLGVEPQDVNVLKLLYLVRYVDDVKANLDNIVILMADDIRMDKITMRGKVLESLNRLLSQNYIGRTGDAYNFLTDEEQEIAVDIRRTVVDMSSIVERISHMIFGDIYTTKKFRSGAYDFSFNQMVDNQAVGLTIQDAMTLRILTVAADPVEKSDMRLMTDSKGRAIVVMADTPYYESLENAMKIRKYVKQRNVSQLPKSVQDIIRDQQDEAGRYEETATATLADAIIGARFYVDGELLTIRPGSVSVSEDDPAKKELKIKQAKAKDVIDQALGYLVSRVYSDLGLIEKNAATDADIQTILSGDQQVMDGMEPNSEAARKVLEHLEIQDNQNRTVSMDDLQRKYQGIPFGWREIDVAAVVALLIHRQQVTVKYSGVTIQPDDPNLLGMLRKKNEVAKTVIAKRKSPSITKIREVREFMRDYFDEMDVPEDEDGLVAHIKERFTGELDRYTDMLKRYEGHKYPDRTLVDQAIVAMKDILSQTRDNIALIDRVIAREDSLYSLRDKMHDVEDFFKTRVGLFDSAVKFEQDLRVDLDYIAKDEEANKALNTVRLIIMIPPQGSYNYKRLTELHDLMDKVKASHDAMLEKKREDLLEIIRQCMSEIHTLAGEDLTARAISAKADTFFGQKKQQIADTEVLMLLDGLVPQIWSYKDDTIEKIEPIVHPPVHVEPADPPKSDEPPKPPVQKVIKAIYRQQMFPAKTLTTDAEIDAYVERIRANMKQLLKDCDGIKLS